MKSTPTPKELREATERLRKYRDGVPLEQIWGDNDFDGFGLECDRIRIVAAYLAQHEADDDDTEDSIVGATILAVGKDNSLLLDGPCGQRRRVWMLEKSPEEATAQ